MGDLLLLRVDMAEKPLVNYGHTFIKAGHAGLKINLRKKALTGASLAIFRL